MFKDSPVTPFVPLSSLKNMVFFFFLAMRNSKGSGDVLIAELLCERTRQRAGRDRKQKTAADPSAPELIRKPHRSLAGRRLTGRFGGRGGPWHRLWKWNEQIEEEEVKQSASRAAETEKTRLGSCCACRTSLKFYIAVIPI